MPGFNITNFFTSVNTKGVLRDNSFILSIMPPQVMSNFSATQTINELSLRCESVNIPGINLQTQDIFRYGTGPVEKSPYSAFFTDVTAQFIVDRDATEYTFFNLWMNSIVNMDLQGGMLAANPQFNSLPYEVRYRSEYATRVFIFVYNDKQEKVVEVTLEDAYPLTLHDTPFNWNNQDAMVKLQVTLNYRSMYIKTLSTGALPAALRIT